MKSSSEIYYDFKIFKAVEKVNELQKLHLVKKIGRFFKNNLQGKHFALWGLAFKPNTDDIREAPALSIIDYLTRAGANITAYDPEAMPNLKAQSGDKIKYATDKYQALEKVDALIIDTEWSEFKTPDFERMKQALKTTKSFFIAETYSNIRK